MKCTKSSINDGNYCSETTFIGKLINHKPDMYAHWSNFRANYDTNMSYSNILYIYQ